MAIVNTYWYIGHALVKVVKFSKTVHFVKQEMDIPCVSAMCCAAKKQPYVYVIRNSLYTTTVTIWFRNGNLWKFYAIGFQELRIFFSKSKILSQNLQT